MYNTIKIKKGERVSATYGFCVGTTQNPVRPVPIIEIQQYYRIKSLKNLGKTYDFSHIIFLHARMNI